MVSGFFHNPQHTMPLLTNLTPTTELEAINAMLSAIGEAPLPAATDLSTVTQSDVASALNTLRMATREVQSRKWRFNTEYNYALATSGSYGSPTKYTFQAPTGTISYTLSRTTAQRGLDLFTRKNRVAIGANASGSLQILADRLTGSDGWSFQTMYLDVVWYVDFESMPDTARRYVTALAAQRFALDAGATPDVLQVINAVVEQAGQALTADQSEEAVAQTATQDNTTELGCVNAVLVANGKTPTPSLDQLNSADAAKALDIVRTLTRSIQIEGWTFNTEKGLKLLPAGVSGGYNVFKAPADVLKWEITRTDKQLDLDLGDRVSKVYQEGGQFVHVLYDRINNIDGIENTELYLDVTWSVAYADLPQTAKDYITIRSARLWAKNAESASVKFTQDEEFAAFRALKRDQGNDDKYNIFDNADTLRSYGRPRVYGVSVWSPRGRR